MGRDVVSLKSLEEYFRKNNAKREQRAHAAAVHSLGWNCNGNKLASGSLDKNVVVYGLNSAGSLKTENVFRGHTDTVDQLRWHRINPELLASASYDKTVRFWDYRAKCTTAVVVTKGETINMAWSPDGNTIAVGNKEDLITFIDTRTNKISSEMQFNFEVNEMAWNSVNDLFCLTSGSGCVHIHSYPNLKQQHVLKSHTGTCICIEYDPTGKYFATGSSDSTVSLWDANELVCLRVLKRLNWPVSTVSFSHDGAMLASASEDRFIDIAHTETGKCIYALSVDTSTFSIAWHPKQYLLAYACDDKNKADVYRDEGNLRVFGFAN